MIIPIFHKVSKYRQLRFCIFQSYGVVCVCVGQSHREMNA